ncbi:MAG: hypothetical protein WBQ75_12590 [Acetobacteraceae bacterium]
MRAALGPSLTHPLFREQDFTPTKFDTAADKAWFANALCKFIANDFRQTLWTRRLYRRLSLTFSNIAHYNGYGFWQEFFADLQGKVAFLTQTLAHPCHGQPDHTYCDVERAVQARLRARDTIATYRALRAAEVEGAERALLDRLREKYDGAPPPRIADMPVRCPPPSPRSCRNDAVDQPSLL